MAQYKSFDTNVEVKGEIVLSVVDGMGDFKIKAYKILSGNGIYEPVPGKWYSQQAWLNAFKTIAEYIGEHTLYQIGETIPEIAQFPSGIDSLGKALSSIDQVYHMNHRGGEIGHYLLERIDQSSVKMVCRNPYPSEFDRGLITAFVKMFKPKGSDRYARVEQDTNAPSRKNGADSCTYLIKW